MSGGSNLTELWIILVVAALIFASGWIADLGKSLFARNRDSKKAAKNGAQKL